MRTCWSVAFRKKKSGSILQDTDTPFTAIKNTLRFWAADPFVFKENGETYIFAELYDSVKARGTIGYCKYGNGGFSVWKSVISESWHLSFPYIFKYKNDIYIMPEAHQSNELYVYKAVSFPDKWIKQKVLFKGKKLADSVILKQNDKTYVFSYEINYPEKNLLYMGEADNEWNVVFYEKPVSDDDGSARPGGDFFSYNGETIRVSQDCKESYGDGLVFSKICKEPYKGFTEEKIRRIGKEDIKVNDLRSFYGTHTYNANDEFEVIDLKTPQSNLSYIFSLPFRLVKKIKRRTKK